MDDLCTIDIPVRVKDYAVWWCITNEFNVLAKFDNKVDAKKHIEKWPAGAFVWSSQTHKVV